MSAFAALLAILANGSSQVAPSELDLFLKPVLDICVLPDLARTSPAKAFAAGGWTEGPEGWVSMDGSTIVAVNWPSDNTNAASCSVYQVRFSPTDFNEWFENRIGPANSIAWDPEAPIAAWKINTNGHPVSIYVAQDKHPKTGDTLPVIHIIQ